MLFFIDAKLRKVNVISINCHREQCERMADSVPIVLSASVALEMLRVGTFWKGTLLSALSHGLLSPSSADTCEAARAKSVTV